MLIEIIFFLFLGMIFGTFTGLIPGIHINLVGAIIVSLSATLLAPMQPQYLIVFIVSMSMTHTFIDFIPSVFLGCPDTDTELSILPGHKLLKEGKGHAAVLLSAKGGLISVFLTMILALPLIMIVKKIYPLITFTIPYILITISLIMILSEKNKTSSILSYALAGFLGLIVLNLSGIKEPLLPLLTGLFGSSTLLLSIKNKTKIPRQTLEEEKVNSARPIIGSLLASPLCGFLPGLGSGQAAILGNTIAKTDQKGFIVLLGATNTFVMGFSFLSLYAISKTRTGSAVAIKELIGIPSGNLLFLILLTALIAGIGAFFMTRILSAFFSKRMEKIDYAKLSWTTLAFLTILIVLISGLLGLAVFAVSTATGIYCISLGVRRTNMMACLLIPTIFLYLF